MSKGKATQIVWPVILLADFNKKCNIWVVLFALFLTFDFQRRMENGAH